MAQPTQKNYSAPQSHVSGSPELSLPSDIVIGKVVPCLASKFRVSDLLSLSIVSHGFHTSCERWRNVIVKGWSLAREAQRNSNESFNLDEIAPGKWVPCVDLGAGMLLELLKFKRDNGQWKGRTLVEAPRLLTEAYSGLEQSHESTPPATPGIPGSAAPQSSALCAYAMLQSMRLRSFGDLPAHFMLIAMCAAVEEGPGSSKVAAMLGRINPDGLIAYLQRRGVDRYQEPPNYANLPAFVDFGVDVIKNLPQGAGQHACNLMLAAVNLRGERAPNGDILGEEWQLNLALMNVALENLHKLGSANDQARVLSRWVEILPAVLPRLCLVLASESKNFPELGKAAAWKRMNEPQLRQALGKSLCAMKPESRSALVRILQEALALNRLPTKQELDLVRLKYFEKPIGNMEVGRLFGLFVKEMEEPDGDWCTMC